MEEAETEWRIRLVAMLRRCGAFGLRDLALEDSFVQGRFNPPMAALGFDSLSQMELCIALEDEAGISISPAELGELYSLGDLLSLLIPRSR